jgi:hypothetical protein
MNAIRYALRVLLWGSALKLPSAGPLDRQYSRTRDRHLLWDRRVMVAKRRACRVE